MYIANVLEDGFENNPHLDVVREIAAKEGAIVVPVCAAIESEISELEDDEKAEFLESMGLSEPGLNRVIRGGYSLLNLHTYFTAGVKRSSRLDYPCWRNCTTSGWCHPHRFRAWFHSRASRCI